MLDINRDYVEIKNGVFVSKYDIDKFGTDEILRQLFPERYK